MPLHIEISVICIKLLQAIICFKLLFKLQITFTSLYFLTTDLQSLFDCDKLLSVAVPSVDSVKPKYSSSLATFCCFRWCTRNHFLAL